MTEEANAHATNPNRSAGNALAAAQRQLFLDDDDVALVENLRKTFHQPRKRGAVIRREPALGGNPEIRCAPVWDPERQLWKLWTICVTPEELHGIAGLSGYHESRDGLHWYQPIVRQAGYRGTRANNLVYIPMGDGCTAEILGAVYDRTDPDPNRRYKALSFTMAPELAILFATSPDGIHWTRLDIPPIASGDEPNFSFDERNRLFIATVKVPGPFGRSHALTVSEDFEHWSEPQLVFHADEEDQEQAREIIAARLADPSLQQPVFNHPEEHAVDVYNFAISRYESRYIGFASMFYHTGRAWNDRNHDGFHHVQLAGSRDMLSWRRVGNRAPFIGPSPLGAGAYDTMQILGPSFPIVRDDQLWFYYSGIRHRWQPPKAAPERAAICLATLRRDGFVSLDADADGGAVTTVPLLWQGKRLYLNADAADGEIRCELVDATDQTLPGFEQKDSIPISDDGVRLAVGWRRQERMPANAAGPIQLRIWLRDARLYSYWIE